VNCARKPKAEDYPKNFALLKLAEKTMAKAKQHEVQAQPADPQDHQATPTSHQVTAPPKKSLEIEQPTP